MMKKIQAILTIGLLLGLLFAAANVFADSQPAAAELAKPTKQTPGAKATDKANDQSGNGNAGNDHSGGGQGQGHGSDNTPGAKATEKANERAAEGVGKRGQKRMTFKGRVATAGGGSLT